MKNIKVGALLTNAFLIGGIAYLSTMNSCKHEAESPNIKEAEYKSDFDSWERQSKMEVETRIHGGVSPIFSPARADARPYDVEKYEYHEGKIRSFVKELIEKDSWLQYQLTNNTRVALDSIQNSIEMKFDRR